MRRAVRFAGLSSRSNACSTWQNSQRTPSDAPEPNPLPSPTVTLRFREKALMTLVNSRLGLADLAYPVVAISMLLPSGTMGDSSLLLAFLSLLVCQSCALGQQFQQALAKVEIPSGLAILIAFKTRDQSNVSYCHVRFTIFWR